MTRSEENNFKDVLISIGGLSRASGVPVETLRNWERRYGFPKPSRLDSGHRRYPLDIVERLRLIKQVLELGHKPSFATMASETELERIIAETSRIAASDAREPSRKNLDEELDSWFKSVETMDAAGLEASFRRAWSGWGAFHFVTKLLVPFFREVGERWFDGRHTVAHEHFASEVAQSFLAAMWRPLSQRARCARVVLANLEGEMHCLGLHMASVFLALKGIEVVFLGPNTPRLDIVTAAGGSKTAALVIGLSAASNTRWAAHELEKLRAELKSELIVAFGGNNRMPRIPGVQWIESFEEFEKWCAGLAESADPQNPQNSPSKLPHSH